MRAPLVALIFGLALLATKVWATGLADADQDVRMAMAKSGTPGVSAALVRDCRVVEARAWGVQNLLTRKPLTPLDRMQAASLGKPVAALGIIKLSQSGMVGLGLDDPLGARASAIGLRPPAEAAKITLGELLSHASGLPASGVTLKTAPGGSFHYSGAGFVAAQHLVDQRGPPTLIARLGGLVFQPLGMFSSSYTALAEAPGHLPANSILQFVIPPLLGLAILFAVIIAVATRLRTARWRISSAALLGSAILGAIGACGALSVPLGFVSLTVTLPLAISFVLVVALGVVLARWPGHDRIWPRWVGGGAAALSFLVISTFAVLPFPTRLGGSEGNIAYSLVTTPSDLGRFMAGLMKPSISNQSAVKAMLIPRIQATPSIAWSAGIGHVRLADGSESLWQWGGNPGVKNLLIGFPGECSGLAVLTNGPHGDIPANALSRRLFGVDPAWKVP